MNGYSYKGNHSDNEISFFSLGAAPKRKTALFMKSLFFCKASDTRMMEKSLSFKNSPPLLEVFKC